MNCNKMIMVLLIVSLKIVSSVSEYCDSEFDCVPIEECPKLEYIIKTTKNVYNDPRIKFCGPKTDELLCCPIEEEKTISENKCLEFAKLCPKEGLIHHGTKTREGEFPFMVSVQFKEQNDDKYRWDCGGSLIDSKFVLTAAHCLDQLEYGKNTSVSVVLGAYNTTGSGIRFNVVKITKHPGYGSSDKLADLALLELQSEVNFTDNIKPICLPKTNGSEEISFTAIGWGPYNLTASPNVLLKTTLRQVSYEIGKSFINKNELEEGGEEKRICATPIGKSGDVCGGDSGGPLFVGYPGRGDCLFALMAVVSEGTFCHAANSHTFHTRVFYYREWIEGVVWPQETTATIKPEN